MYVEYIFLTFSRRNVLSHGEQYFQSKINSVIRSKAMAMYQHMHVFARVSIHEYSHILLHCSAMTKILIGSCIDCSLLIHGI